MQFVMAARRPGSGSEEDAWVREVLEPDQLVAYRQSRRLGRAHLGLGRRILLWGMRGYVLFMLVVVAYQVATTLRGGS